MSKKIRKCNQLFAGVLCCLGLSSCFMNHGHRHDHSSKQDIQIQVETEKKPWTHLNFHNDPNNFQFAIVSDRTGGLRPGVFPKAIKRLNSLEPEFVITVGDLITANRHTKDEPTAHKMWDEMDSFIGELDMPFFYLAGNHDNGSPLLSKVWKERFGVERYHFVYKDVLFLCMNAQDSQDFKAVIEQEQQDWALQVLEENQDVRWTFVFIHQPVWVYEKGVPINEGGRTLEARETGWQPIEDALQSRPHTAFAGHVHQYVKYKQKKPNTNYYSLATTGGGSGMRGTDFGEFDHATWVTMTDDGPKVTNLLIDGILPDDVNTEADEIFRGLLNLSASMITRDDVVEVDLKLSFDNKLKHDLSGKSEWEIPVLSDWKASPSSLELTSNKGEAFEHKLKLTFAGDPKKILPLPKLITKMIDDHGDEYTMHHTLPIDINAYLGKRGLPLQEVKGKKKPKKKKK